MFGSTRHEYTRGRWSGSFFQQDNKTKASNFNTTKWIQFPHFELRKSNQNQVTKNNNLSIIQYNVHIALIADYEMHDLQHFQFVRYQSTLILHIPIRKGIGIIPWKPQVKWNSKLSLWCWQIENGWSTSTRNEHSFQQVRITFEVLVSEDTVFSLYDTE